MVMILTQVSRLLSLSDMRYSLIVAASENNVIGRNNALPWNLPDDLKHFRSLTENKAIIMGRKTYESIGHPLKNRTNIVLTRQSDTSIPGCIVAQSLSEAFECIPSSIDEVFVIGGADIYAQALGIVDRIYLTRVHAVIDGDAFFPAIDPLLWRCISQEEHRTDDRHTYAFSYEMYERA